MTTPRVLLLHGVQHRREQGHWLGWLAEELRRARIPVQYPQLPEPDAPTLDSWREVTHTELSMLGDGPRVVIGHSLGTTLWGHLSHDLDPSLAVDRALLVGPPSHSIWWDAIATFSFNPDTFGRSFSRAAQETLVLGRAQDQYRPESLDETTAGWDARIHELPGAGHINTDDGHGPWPWVLDWVRGDAGPPSL